MPSSRQRSTVYTLVIALCVVQYLLAVVLARQSCDWSLPAYFVGGIIVVVTMLMLPYVLRRSFPRHNRTPMALVFALAGLVSWLVGLGLVFGASGCGG
jgi:hypothetical protein